MNKEIDRDRIIPVNETLNIPIKKNEYSRISIIGNEKDGFRAEYIESK